VLSSAADENQLITAEIQYLVEDVPNTIDEHYQGLADLLDQLKEHPSAQAMGLPPVTNDSELSYQMSWMLPFTPEEKMSAFQFLSPQHRLEFIARKVSQLSQI